jgi:2-methylcitrate dehydratase PrpD
MTVINAEKKTLTETLAAFIHDLKYEDLPEKVKEIARHRILDALSSAYAGSNLQHSQTAAAIASNNPGNISVWGYGLKSALPYAVMANCVLAHSVLLEDCCGGEPRVSGHPSTIIVPAVLSLAEQERSTGKEVIAAIVLGYEMLIRLGRSTLPMKTSTFRSALVYATFGAAAAAGRLMKLDVAMLANALGYAATLTAGVPMETWWAGTMDSMFEAGWAARTGIESAVLAKGGATAAPSVLEGRHGFLNCWSAGTDGVQLLTSHIGDPFLIEGVNIKPYPACAGNQQLIQSALPLAKFGLTVKDIDKIVMRTGPGYGIAGSNLAGPFRNQFQAQMSRQFCGAAAILGWPMDSISTYTEHYRDPEIGELAKKIEPTPEPGRTKIRFEVYTRDGRILVGEEEKIDYEYFIPSTEKMGKRILKLASVKIGEKRVLEIIDIVRDLENVTDIHELTALL